MDTKVKSLPIHLLLRFVLNMICIQVTYKAIYFHHCKRKITRRELHINHNNNAGSKENSKQKQKCQCQSLRIYSRFRELRCAKSAILYRPFPSSPGPLYQNEVKCSAFDMEKCFILMQIKLIFTRKVVHLASFWKWGFWNSEVVYWRREC